MVASGAMLQAANSADLVAASLLAWWAEAGVDTLVDEQPRDWTIAAAQPTRAAPLSDAAAAPAGTPVAKPNLAFPNSIETLGEWYLSADIPGAGPRAQRLAPAGDPRARLMVIVDMPEPEDVAAGMLLAGDAGVLFEKMLAAIGYTRETIWFVPMCPGRILGGGVPPETSDAIAKMTRLHVELVRPAKLWLLGRAASRAIIGIDEVQARGRLHKFNHNGTTTDVIASVHPRVLLQTPKRKTEVWADMQRLTEE